MKEILERGLVYAIFGALTWITMNMISNVFASMDFSTGELSTNNATFLAALSYALIGGAVGFAVGALISIMPGEHGKWFNLVHAIVIPICTFLLAILFIFAASIVMAFLALFGIVLLDRQGQIIIWGVWIIILAAVPIVIGSTERFW